MEIAIIQVTPNELQQLIKRSVEEVIEKHIPKSSAEEKTSQWLNVDELCQYIPDRPARGTIYGWVHYGTIPHHKGGKKLRFLKSEIDEWLSQGKRKSHAQIEAEANRYLAKKKRG